jgi:outer membrane protein
MQCTERLACLTIICLTGLAVWPVAAQQPSVPGTQPASGAPPVVHLTLAAAKERALANNKLLNLASMNAAGKTFAIRAVQADYFPKVSATAMYLHFNDDLGTVLTGGGRTVTGPRGAPLLTFPTFSVNAAVVNQDSSFVTLGLVQPLTDIFKINQGVKIAEADQQIAHAEWEKGVREVLSGVSQLYWGLLAAYRIRAGAAAGLPGAEMLAKTGNLEGRLAVVETRQALQAVDKEIAALQEQLLALLDMPLCTVLELEEPPLPLLPYKCADEVVALALRCSPEVHSAEQTILKAQAALKAGKLDYLPSIGLAGGYVNQTAASYIQQDIGYVGVVGNVTLFEGCKRRYVVRERENLLAMANLKLQQVEDEVRQKVVKAFRELAESQEAVKTAAEMVDLRKQIEKQATTPEVLRDPKPLIEATKKRLTAEVDAIKAELAFRQAYVIVMSLICKD